MTANRVLLVVYLAIAGAAVGMVLATYSIMRVEYPSKPLAKPGDAYGQTQHEVYVNKLLTKQQ